MSILGTMKKSQGCSLIQVGQSALQGPFWVASVALGIVKSIFFCQTKLCQELLDGLGQDFVQTFRSWTMNVNDFGDPLTFPLALP